MIFNNYLIFITLFIAIAVRSEEIEFTDLNSIEKFVSNIIEFKDSYTIDNHSLSEVDKNNIAKRLLNDSVNLMNKIYAIQGSGIRLGNFESIYLMHFIDQLDRHRPRGEYLYWEPFSRILGTINHKSEKISSYGDLLSSMGVLVSTDDLMKHCPILVPIMRKLAYGGRTNILREYQEFIENLREVMKDENSHNFCGKTWSFNLGIYYLHQKVAMSHIQEFLMIHHLNKLNNLCRDHNLFDSWIRVYTIMDELKKIKRITRDLLSETRHYLHACDLEKSTNKVFSDNKESHYELERMIQTIIIKEQDLTTDGSCSHNCKLGHIDIINTTECDEYYNCQYISPSYNICETTCDSRRYRWFNDSNGVVYGDGAEKCDSPMKFVSSKFAFFKFRYCDYCMCTCLKKTGDKEATTAISFREQVTDINNNMAVVGVRFVEKNLMIHVQIKEKHMERPGFESSDSWKELENIQYNETAKTFYNSENTVLKPGIDYGHPKIVNFDDLIAPRGYVITGVRLGFAVDKFKKPDLEAAAIELHIRVTPFDYNTGKLINLTQTHWIVPEYTSREELILTNPDNPLKSPANVIDSKKNQFIRFRNSDLKKDAGQTTVPFFDAQDVEGALSYPLGGMGIIHRGHECYGGFLAFKIYDINLADALNTE
ncbi:uncharacterized protein LOC103574641 isoform X3 [Microplitis demolitor]|uniref:uncharacterized protein LOC103574641 isoform X3 n=1 Tax=Microplitis demolitor TaxID=69319 RepID=UPI0004CCBB94|nr:uncharacterized protein LOC103574641 isoform X3 [Microplitis demolitor]